MNLPKYRTMSEIATETIREAILSASYPSGTRLIPAKLEKELNLGRTAIREALRELVCTGLVVSIPNKGAIVAEPPEIEEIEQIFAIRYLVEGKATELATPRITPEALKRLEEMHERMCAGHLSGHEYFALNKEFHILIYELSGWAFLCNVIVHLIEKVRSCRAYYPVRPEDLDSYNRDHGGILRVLKEKKADEVSQLVVSNIRRGFEALRAVYELRKSLLDRDKEQVRQT